MNPYEVLGVANNATPEEIKAAYRKLAMKHHPDQHGGSEEATAKFQEIQAAYDMLRADKPKREQQHQHRQPPPGWTFHFGGGDPSSMFEEMIRRHQEAAMHAEMIYQAYTEITLEEAFSGCEREFNLPNGQTITVAIPAGIEHGQYITLKDAITEDKDTKKGTLRIVVRVHTHPTFERYGSLLTSKAEVGILDAILGCEKEITTITGQTIRIKLPPNTKPGTVITVPGEGMPVPNQDGARGDLQVLIFVNFREFSEEERKILEQLR